MFGGPRVPQPRLVWLVGTGTILNVLEIICRPSIAGGNPINHLINLLINLNHSSPQKFSQSTLIPYLIANQCALSRPRSLPHAILSLHHPQRRPGQEAEGWSRTTVVRSLPFQDHYYLFEVLNPPPIGGCISFLGCSNDRPMQINGQPLRRVPLTTFHIEGIETGFSFYTHGDDKEYRWRRETMA